MKKGLILMVKGPELGKVKTRLAQAIGEKSALKLHKAFAKDTVKRFSGLDCDLHIFLTGDNSSDKMKDWLGKDLPLHVQKGNDLGERMKHAFQEMFDAGYHSCLVMGSDLPDVPLTIPQEAFRKLENSRSVIAPSEDGGYYLLGFTRSGFLPSVFHRVEWGSSSVFSQTLDIFLRHNRSPIILPVWRDIDDMNDLEDVFQRNRDSREFQSSHTMKILKTIF